jgi:uncharacterized protein (DUF305 family)
VFYDEEIVTVCFLGVTSLHDAKDTLFSGFLHMRTLSIFSLLAASVLSLPMMGASFAQDKMPPAGHHGMGHHSMMPAASNPNDAESTKAFRAANDAMHKGMDIPFTNNPDVDFIRGMIPHHEGAVEMANIVLKYGKDPEVRKLAQEIIAAQDKEIAFMKKWLEKNAASILQ